MKRTTPPTDTSFGTGKSRFDLFDAGLKRIEARLGQLIPPPVRNIPILIGGSGPKRTLPAMARYADIWHTVLAVEGFIEASALVNELAAATGRDGNDTERSVHWLGAESADAYRRAGVTTFITEIAPHPPVMTSAHWRTSWPGVTVRSDVYGFDLESLGLSM